MRGMEGLDPRIYHLARISKPRLAAWSVCTKYLFFTHSWADTRRLKRLFLLFNQATRYSLLATLNICGDLASLLRPKLYWLLKASLEDACKPLHYIHAPCIKHILLLDLPHLPALANPPAASNAQPHDTGSSLARSTMHFLDGAGITQCPPKSCQSEIMCQNSQCPRSALAE